MAKTTTADAKNARKSKLIQGEQLDALKDLRKRGVLTRQQFRTLCFDKGLQQNENRGPWSPEYVSHELVKHRDGTKEIVSEVKLWTRYSK